MSSNLNLARRGTGLCILSLDAGGSRGVSQLRMLAEMMHRLNFDAGPDQKKRPCDVFDMIGGTGSGGFIAILLVILKLTANDALEEFIDLSVNVLDKPGIDAPSRTTALKERIDNLIKKHGIDFKSRLLYPSDVSQTCKLVVPISYKGHIGSTCIIRNFLVRREETLDMTIVEALSATLATPPLFTSTSIFKDVANFEYISADWTLSNPTQEIISETQGAFGTERKVACILSLGCGLPGIFSAPESSESVEWVQFLNNLTSDAERKAQSLDSQMGHIGLYSRFSVGGGLETTSLRRNIGLGDIVAHTKVYLDNGPVSRRIDLCIDMIRMREGTLSFDQLKHPSQKTVLYPQLPPITKSFVMRRVPWEFIRRVVFSPRDPEDLDGPRVLIVTGIGGCGKTQLILKFMKVHEAEFLSQFFIDGSSEDRIRADIIRHVRTLGGEYSQMEFDECLLFLSQQSPNGSRLLFYDNVDEPDLDLSPLLPHGDSCTVFITSRNSTLGDLYPNSHLQLDIMTRDEAVDLLLHRSSAATDQHQKDARELAQALGYLPIALQQATSYMQQTKCSIRTYIARLSSSRHKLLAQSIRQQINMREISTYAAFETSFGKLHLYAQRFLRLLACFHWSGFPLELITLAAGYAFSQYNFKYLESGVDYYVGKMMLESVFLRDGDWDVLNLDQMVVSLQNYSLVTVVAGIDTSLLQIHPLVHEWLLSCINEADAQSYQSAAVLLLALGGREDHTAATQYLESHVTHMSPLWENLHVNDAMGFARILRDNGVYEGTLQLQEMAAKLTRAVLSKDDMNLSFLLWEFARTCQACGRFNEAAALQEEILKVMKESSGEMDLNTLMAANNLALTYRDLGRLKEAEEVQLEVLELRKVVQGERDQDTLLAANNLACTYYMLGQLKEAEILQVRVLKLRKEVLGERNIHTLVTLGNLALTYLSLGRLKEAEDIQVEVLNLRKDHLGEHHPDTVLSLHDLALTYHALGRLTEAKEMQIKALNQRKETFGDRNPHTIEGSISLASTYRDLGLLKEAKVIQMEVIKLSREVMGEHHPDTVNASHHLATTCRDQGYYEEALTIQEQVLKARLEIQGQHHPSTILASSDLAIILQRLGRLDEAHKLATEVAQRRGEILGARHPDTIQALSNLASIYCDLGKHDEAEALQLDALAAMQDILGERHFQTTSGMLVLAKIHIALQKRDDALRLLATAGDIIFEELGVAHPQYRDYQEFKANALKLEEIHNIEMPPQHEVAPSVKPTPSIYKP